MTFSSNAPANTKHWQQSMELAAVHIGLGRSRSQKNGLTTADREAIGRGAGMER